MNMGNKSLQQFFILKNLRILALILCLWGLVGATGLARAENPLFQPILDQNLAAIEFLIREGIDVNQPNEFGLTPLEFAIRARTVASAQLLFRYGASFDLIDPAVINEFRIKPGIGPFVERYSNATNQTITVLPNSLPTAGFPRTAATLPQNNQQQITRTPAQAITQNPNSYLGNNVGTTTGLVNRLVPPTTIGVATNRVATNSVATNSIATSNIATQSPPTPPTTTDVGLNSVLDNVLQGLETAPINTLVQNQALTQPIPQTITVAPNYTQPNQIQSTQQTINSNNQILALSQNSGTNSGNNAVTNTPATLQETVSTLPTTPQDIAVPTTQPTTYPSLLPQQRLPQVHFDNPSQTCQVKNYNLVVSFIFDDGESSDLDVIREVFTPRQVTGTLGIILNRMDIDDSRYMPTSELKNLYNLGWEIASHTINHDDLTSLDSQDLDDDLLKSHQGLRSLGFDVSSLVYPYGANNGLVRAHTSKYYYGAFEGGYRLNTRSSNPFKLKRFHIAEAHDFNYYKRVTDSYSNQHGWLVWAVHTNLNFGQAQVDDLHQLLDYMCDQGIRVVNARDGLDHLNLVE